MKMANRSAQAMITLVAMLIAGSTVGCGRMLDGKIYSLANRNQGLFSDDSSSITDSIAMPMQIEVSYGQGKMTAQNPKSGERVAGTYSGVREGNTTQANAIATLIGDQGTVLDCVMRIQAGLSPHGMGTAKDNRGREYRIQF
jgi:hypothetical protein